MYDHKDEDELPRQGKKKNTKKWCRGKVGAFHEFQIVKSRHMDYECQWKSLLWKENHVRYRCYHEKSCIKCGKVVEWFLNDPKECPDYKECSCGMQ